MQGSNTKINLEVLEVYLENMPVKVKIDRNKERAEKTVRS